MIVYRALRRAASTALGWYYADVVVQGREHMPSHGPVLLVANHPNALVDAMAVAVSVPRRVLLTAKATLFQQPLLAAALRVVGVVPLRRAKDEPTTAAPTPRAPQPPATPSAARNTDAFLAVTAALARGEVVLIFPEGISHDAPAIAPLRTGAARMALMAHEAGISSMCILPVGLVYEAKEQPQSRVLVRLGGPLHVDGWVSSHGVDAVALTAEIERRLRQVTLNFASEERAQRAVTLARMLDAIARDVPPLGHPPTLATEAALAQRIDAANDALAAAPHDVARRADAFVADMETFGRQLGDGGVALSELRVSPRVGHGARFALREALLLALAVPVALVDRLAHDVPVRTARSIARRSLVTDPSRDQPAMRTILLAAGLLLLWYVVLGAALVHWLGWPAALLALAVMASSASAELALRGRLARASRRARSYLMLRADPAFRTAALAEADRLLEEARALERALFRGESAGPPAGV